MFNIYYHSLKKKKTTLTELSPAQIYNKYANSVVLIKHSFLYTIKLGNDIYYFKDFDPETGEIDELKSFDELKDNPNVIWGSGFFVNDDGYVLTNRHLVNIKPTDEEQNKILNFLKTKILKESIEIQNVENNLNDRLNDIESTINNVTLSEYEFSQLQNEYNDIKHKLDEIHSLQKFHSTVLETSFLPYNFVSKTSIDFGIFLNKDKSIDYNDYIKYQSVAVSNDINVDLALLKPKHYSDISQHKIKKVDSSLLDSLNFKERKINDKLSMIGYNRGIEIATTTEGITPQLTEGNISQISDNFKILYTIPTLPGSSGSPVFDKYGRVISINFAGWSKTQNFNYGIQNKKITRIFKE